jgi:hypothetical protein
MTTNQPLESPTDLVSLAPRLYASLRARRTYLMIYQDYLRQRPKADVAQLLGELSDDTQDTIAMLSSLLRQKGHSPLAAGINETLFQQARRRRGTLSKLNFLMVGSKNTLAWYEDCQRADDPPEVQVFWQELIARETDNLRRVKDLLGAIEVASTA